MRLATRKRRLLKHLRLRGVQMHIGSQITQVAPFEQAVRKLVPLASALKAAHGIEFFSIGGGLGIDAPGVFLAAHARVLQQSANQALHALGAFHGVANVLVGAFVNLALVTIGEQLHVAGNHAQRFLQVVRGHVRKLLEVGV